MKIGQLIDALGELLPNDSIELHRIIFRRGFSILEFRHASADAGFDYLVNDSTLRALSARDEYPQMIVADVSRELGKIVTQPPFSSRIGRHPAGSQQP